MKLTRNICSSMNFAKVNLFAFQPSLSAESKEELYYGGSLFLFLFVTGMILSVFIYWHVSYMLRDI